MRQVPVIALTGHLGAGKTTVLNHLLGAPGARLGVVINDLGVLNVDAGLAIGHINEMAGIRGKRAHEHPFATSAGLKRRGSCTLCVDALSVGR